MGEHRQELLEQWRKAENLPIIPNDIPAATHTKYGCCARRTTAASLQRFPHHERQRLLLLYLESQPITHTGLYRDR